MRIFSKEDSYIDLAGIAFVIKARKRGLCASHKGLDLVFMDENGELIATDGHRCHKYKMGNPVIPGRHMVVVSMKTKIILVPVESPCDPPNYNKVFTTKENHVDLECSFDSGLFRIIRALPKTAGVNVKYLQDALSGEMHSVKCGNGLQPLVFTGNGVSAAVMPVLV